MKWTRQNRDIGMETCTVANGTRCMICIPIPLEGTTKGFVQGQL